MATKLTMVFSYTSNGNGQAVKTRTGSWSESYYRNSVFSETTQNLFEDLCAKRAVLLPKFSRIDGQRYQPVNPVGPSQIRFSGFPGNPSFDADAPQSTLYIQAFGSDVRNTRAVKLKAIPDNQSKFGEYQPEDAYKLLLLDFMATLRAGNFAFRARDLSYPESIIQGITPQGDDGLVLLEPNNTFSVGQFVRILRTLNANKRKIGGRYRVKALGIGANAFIIEGWDGGITTGGSVRRDEIFFPTISDARVVRITMGKIGRPSGGYVGRRSAR